MFPAAQYTTTCKQHLLHCLCRPRPMSAVPRSRMGSCPGLAARMSTPRHRLFAPQHAPRLQTTVVDEQGCTIRNLNLSAAVTVQQWSATLPVSHSGQQHLVLQLTFSDCPCRRRLLPQQPDVRLRKRMPCRSERTMGTAGQTYAVAAASAGLTCAHTASINCSAPELTTVHRQLAFPRHEECTPCTSVTTSVNS
jgi:hypothetical protein